MKRDDMTQTADIPEINATPERFTRVRLTWVAYWMLGYFAFLEAVLGPLMPFIQSDLRLSYLLASLHFSAFALGVVVVGATADQLTRWWGRRISFWGGGLGMAVGALLVALSPIVVGTIAGAFLMGLLGGLLLITIQAVLADHYGRWTPVALTEANVVASAFAFLAPVLVGLVTGAALSWRLSLLPVIAFFLIVGLLYRREPFPSRPTTIEETAASGRTRLPLAYWAFWLLIVLETGAEWCVAYWGASFLVAASTLSMADAAAAMGAFFLAMLLARFAGSRLTRVMSGAIVLAGSLVVALIGFPLFWLAPLPFLRLVGLFVVGLGLANVYPLGVALATRVVPGEADRASARTAVAGGLSALVAPFILGALSDHIGIVAAFGVALPMLLLALLFAVAAGRAHARLAA